MSYGFYRSDLSPNEPIRGKVGTRTLHDEGFNIQTGEQFEWCCSQLTLVYSNSRVLGHPEGFCPQKLSHSLALLSL
jgi:hypothetical protein